MKEDSAESLYRQDLIHKAPLSLQNCWYNLSTTSAPRSNLMATSVGFLLSENSAKAY